MIPLRIASLIPAWQSNTSHYDGKAYGKSMAHGFFRDTVGKLLGENSSK
jgi:hypothetical protein